MNSKCIFLQLDTNLEAMIEFHEALQIIKENAVTLGTEHVSLPHAHRRVLANDTFYDVHVPPFDKSAMDGYACRMKDIANELEVIETIFAGKKPENSIGQNQCAKIMTGAVVPDGADCVIMKEHIEEVSENRIICPSGKTKANICYTGEDVQVGDMALPKNSFLTAKHLPILAGAGCHNPEVFIQPKVTVFATGSELVEPNEKPLSYQIRNSNSSQMMAQLAEMGIDGTYGGIVKDNFEETLKKFTDALETNDVIIMSGGVSVGDFDFIPLVIEKLGFEILITRSAIQPGKPVIFARKGNKYCFGLAGNPASSFIQFELYLKTFFYGLMGYDFQPVMTKAKMTKSHSRKKTERLLFVPSQLNPDHTVSPVDYHGAAHINALVNANSLVLMPIGVRELKEGDEVDVRSL